MRDLLIYFGTGLVNLLELGGMARGVNGLPPPKAAWDLSCRGLMLGAVLAGSAMASAA